MKEPDLRTKEERQLAALESIEKRLEDLNIILSEGFWKIAVELRETRRQLNV